MVIVEVYVPSLDKTYEFKLNEDVATGVIIDELSSVICQKERCPVAGDKSELVLASAQSKQVLSVEFSLYENGIQTGDRLILV